QLAGADHTRPAFLALLARRGRVEEARVQAAARHAHHALSQRPEQVQAGVGAVCHYHQASAWTPASEKPHGPGGLLRQCLVPPLSPGIDRLRSGKPHVRLAKPGLTITCKDSHRKPAVLAKTLRLECTASRQIPVSRILAPHRCSTESSTPITSASPSGTNAACRRPSRIFAPCRPDHCAHERNRW